MTRRSFVAPMLLVGVTACRLGASEMPRPAPEIIRTEARSPFEIDPLLDVTLPPLDGGADAASSARAADSYRAPEAGVGARSPAP